MSNLSRFLKQNKSPKSNTTFTPTSSFLDDKGNPIEWLIKPLSSKENEEIRDACTIEIPDENNPGNFKSKLDFSKYKNKVLCACVLEPCLFNKELQDSYEVNTPEELIYEMIDGPGEYDKFVDFVFKFNGFGSDKDKVDNAKNL